MTTAILPLRGPTILRRFFMICAVGAALSCDKSSPAELPDRNPDVVGTVITFPSSDRVLIGVHPTSCEGIVLTITGMTRFFLKDGQTLIPATRSQMVHGQPARAWAAGAIAESCPRQAAAETIELAGAWLFSSKISPAGP